MGQPGTVVILPSGAVGILPDGRVAVFGQDGVCAECCGGGGGPGDESACYAGCVSVVHQDAVCGIPDGQTPEFPTWVITVEGTVTYEESVLWRRVLEGNVLVSDVPRQTRTFSQRVDVPQTPTPRCGFTVVPPAGDPSYVFAQNAPAGQYRSGQPYVRFSLLEDVRALRRGTLVWNTQDPRVSAWQFQGPRSAEGSNENTVTIVGASQGSRYGVSVFSQPVLNDVPTGFLTELGALWTPTRQSVFCQTELASTYSQPELASYYDRLATGFAEAGAVPGRQACRYSIRHVGAGGMSGVRTGGNGRDTYEASMAYEFDVTIAVRLAVCQAAGLRAGWAPDDPRVVAAAEASLRRCRGCGE